MAAHRVGPHQFGSSALLLGAGVAHHGEDAHECGEDVDEQHVPGGEEPLMRGGVHAEGGAGHHPPHRVGEHGGQVRQLLIGLCDDLDRVGHVEAHQRNAEDPCWGVDPVAAQHEPQQRAGAYQRRSARARARRSCGVVTQGGAHSCSVPQGRRPRSSASAAAPASGDEPPGADTQGGDLLHHSIDPVPVHLKDGALATTKVVDAGSLGQRAGWASPSRLRWWCGSCAAARRGCRTRRCVRRG